LEPIQNKHSGMESAESEKPLPAGPISPPPSLPGAHRWHRKAIVSRQAAAPVRQAGLIAQRKKRTDCTI
jgi:hypothetical protein